jgi:hypothetical protein
MTKLTPQALQALQYVVNTGGNASVMIFDDDHEPIGPMLRRELMPFYMEELPTGMLDLTPAGRLALQSEKKDG